MIGHVGGKVFINVDTPAIVKRKQPKENLSAPELAEKSSHSVRQSEKYIGTREGKIAITLPRGKGGEPFKRRGKKTKGHQTKKKRERKSPEGAMKEKSKQ